MKTRGVIAATPPVAVEAGAEMFAQGGNAFDAAVAAAWTQTVSDPCMCGIGGLGTATVFEAGKQRSECIQFFARAGSRVQPDMWSRTDAKQLPNGSWVFDDFRNELGYSAVCVPGTVAGLERIRERYGRLSRQQVMGPALTLARRGWTVNPIHEAYWTGDPEAGMPSGRQRLTATPACAALFVKPDGALLKALDHYSNPDLVSTLEAIAEGGTSEFYAGEVGRRMAADLSTGGSFVTADDLRNYQAQPSSPLSATYRGYLITSDSPPGGGLVLLQMLRMLDGYPLGALPHNGTEYLHLVASAMCIAQDDRRRHLADPAFVDVPVEFLLSDQYIASCRQRIASGDLPRPALRDDAPRSTTHLSAADEQGNMIGITHTLGTGSGVVVPGLGFMLNNSMSGFHLHPDHPNAIRRGKARPSAMSPTVVYRPDGRPCLAVGAPGGNRIVSGILQVILNVIDHGMGAWEAVCAPRIHCEGGPLEAEPRIVSSVLDDLRAGGHQVQASILAYDRSLSSPHVAMIGEDGTLSGAADPRRGGHALVV